MTVRYVDQQEETVAITMDKGDGSCLIVRANGIMIGRFDGRGVFVRCAVDSDPDRLAAGLLFDNSNKLRIQ